MIFRRLLLCFTLSVAWLSAPLRSQEAAGMKAILLLLRQSRTEEARAQLRKLPMDAEVLYQTARRTPITFRP